MLDKRACDPALSGGGEKQGAGIGLGVSSESRKSDWLRVRWRGFSTRMRFAVVVALVVSPLVAMFATFHVGEWPAEKRHVYSKYNDALVAKDLTLAWSLGCEADKADVSLSDFVALYQAAVAPLGGLTSWSRDRGGAEWEGTKGSTHLLPRIEKRAGHYCVRLGGSPLGTPF